MGAIPPVDLALAAAAVLVGAGAQRITGLGSGLVSAPFLMLALGPFEGVLLANVVVMTIGLAILTQVWRRVDLKALPLFTIPALIATVPGAWVALTVPGPVLAVIVGTIAFLAVLAVLLSERMRVFRGTGGAIGAGSLSGFMNVTAGVGGPALTLYALSMKWEHGSFVATAQLYFVLVSAASIATKGWPTLGGVAWMAVLASLVLGVVVGSLLAQRVSAVRAHKLVAALALAGSLGTVVKGAVELAG